MNDMPREDENKNIGSTEQLFTQHLMEWCEHLDRVKYSLNPNDAINCQAFQDLVHLGKNESSRKTIITLIEKEYRTYIAAYHQYIEGWCLDPAMIDRIPPMREPSTRIWNYLLVAIDPCFQEAINTGAPGRRSKDIRNAVVG